MASSSNPKKRVKQIASPRKCVDIRGHLEAWFASMHGSETVESINKYLIEFSRKIVNTPKYIKLYWLKFEMLVEVSEKLEFQELERFLGLSGNIYPDLVKVFFTNLKVKEDNIESRVKGFTMKITPSIWATVAGLKCEGLKIGKGNIEAINDHNKVKFYRSCLHNQQAMSRGFQVGRLSLNLRIISLFHSMDIDTTGAQSCDSA